MSQLNSGSTFFSLKRRRLVRSYSTGWKQSFQLCCKFNKVTRAGDVFVGGCTGVWEDDDGAEAQLLTILTCNTQRSYLHDSYVIRERSDAQPFDHDVRQVVGVQHQVVPAVLQQLLVIPALVLPHMSDCTGNTQTFRGPAFLRRCFKERSRLKRRIDLNILLKLKWSSEEVVTAFWGGNLTLLITESQDAERWREIHLFIHTQTLL